MAADPPKPSSDPHPDPAAPAPARGCRLPLATVGILVDLGLNLALCLRLRRSGHDLAFVGLSHLNLLLLFLSLRRFERTPPGSAARGRAMLAVWLLTATLTAAFTWKIGALMPLAFAVAAWVMAAATVLGGFCMLFLLHGDK
ncbi:uncharacterized protein [Miscanthus floridulus]|uniref:uncharacterized protein n=1 Tax=Miscanthus floridulus TaxID=154761 RepID=UPI003457AECA